MEPLSSSDLKLVEEAKRIAYKFSGTELAGENITTVGAAISFEGGVVYSAPNIYHSKIDPYYFCAEPLAIGKAYSDDHKIINTAVAYMRRPNGEEGILPPCERCKKLLAVFGDPLVILQNGKELGKVKLSQL